MPILMSSCLSCGGMFVFVEEKDGRRTYLVLVNGLVGDGPAACADVDGEENGPGHGAVGCKIGPAHEDADFEHETLKQGVMGMCGRVGRGNAPMGWERSSSSAKWGNGD